MTLQLSYKKLLKPLIRLSIIIALMTGIGFNYAGGYDPTLLPGFLIVLSISVLPTMYLLVEYYIYAVNSKITIDEDQISVQIRHRTQCYSFSDIEYIELFKSKGMEKGNFPFQTAEMFYHARLATKNRQKIIITSVTTPSIDEVLSFFENKNIKTTRSVYSTLFI